MIKRIISKIEVTINKIFNKRNTSIILLIFLFAIIILHIYFALHRNTFYDENMYLHEAKTIYRQLSNGEWFGADFTGTHGFLNKFIVALLYLIIGKPVPFIASFFTILVSTIGLILAFKISQRFFSNPIALIISVLYSTSTYIFISSHSFLREIYSAVAVLLFVYFYLTKKKNILISLSLLLILDAKEYVFFILSIPILIYLFIEFLFKIKEVRERYFIFKYLKKVLIIFSLPVLYLLLMVFTSIIPYNSYTGRVLLISEGRLGKMVNTRVIAGSDPAGKDVEKRILKKMDHVKKEILTLTKKIKIESNRIDQIAPKGRILNLETVMPLYKNLIVLARIFKSSAYVFVLNGILKIRRFTIDFRLITMPLFILLSSFIISIIVLCKSLKTMNLPLILISLMFIFFVMVGSLKFGTSRYYCPVIYSMFFFTAFLFTGTISKKTRLSILYFALFTIIISPIINLELDLQKILIFIVLTAILILTIYFEKIDKAKFAGLFYLTAIALLTGVMSVGFSFIGGTHLGYRIYGKNFGFDYFTKTLNKIYETDKNAVVTTNLSQNQFLNCANVYSATPYFRWGPKEKIKKLRRFSYYENKVVASVDLISLLSNDKSDIEKLIKFMIKNKSDYLFVHRLFDGKWGNKPIFNLIISSQRFEMIYYRNDQDKNEGAILKLKK